MDITKLNESSRNNSAKNSFAKRGAVFVAIALFAATSAYAQSVNMTGFCTLYQWMKAAAGVTAVLAIVFIAIQNMFGKSELVEKLVTGVGLSCVLIIGAVALVNGMQLPAQCT